MKVIQRTHDITRAQIIIGFLQANGIDARLLDGETSQVIPAVADVRIAVPEEHEAKAKSLLAEAERARG